MRRRPRVLAFGGSALLVLAGIACALVLGGTFGQVLAFILIAGGLVLATSLVFLEVGLSEDRERGREREQQLKRERQLEREREQRGRPAASNADRRVRLSRLRGERRRLK